MRKHSRIILAAALLTGASFTAASAQLIDLNQINLDLLHPNGDGVNGDVNVNVVGDEHQVINLDADKVLGGDNDNLGVNVGIGDVGGVGSSDLDLLDLDLLDVGDDGVFDVGDLDLGTLINLDAGDDGDGHVFVDTNGDGTPDGDIDLDLSSLLDFVDSTGNTLTGGSTTMTGGDGRTVIIIIRDGDDNGGGGGGGGGGGALTPAAGSQQRVCFYADSGYDGEGVCARGAVDLASLPDGWEDRISSISVEGNLAVQVCGDLNFRGWCQEYTSSIDTLPSGQDNAISSIRVYAR